jgi:hypothetical protein
MIIIRISLSPVRLVLEDTSLCAMCCCFLAIGEYECNLIYDGPSGMRA